MCPRARGRQNATKKSRNLRDVFCALSVDYRWAYCAWTTPSHFPNRALQKRKKKEKNGKRCLINKRWTWGSMSSYSNHDCLTMPWLLSIQRHRGIKKITYSIFPVHLNTVVAEVFVCDLISHISYARRSMRNYISSENIIRKWCNYPVVFETVTAVRKLIACESSQTLV